MAGLGGSAPLSVSSFSSLCLSSLYSVLLYPSYTPFFVSVALCVDGIRVQGRGVAYEFGHLGHSVYYMRA